MEPVDCDGERFETIRRSWIRIFNLLGFAGFGKRRIYDGFDSKYGGGHWLPAHFFEGEPVPRHVGYLMYEEAYYVHLKGNPDLRRWIVSTASEVYDIQPSNIDSGLDYSRQECGATHLQDIAIRRALTRLKLEERGVVPDPASLPSIPIFEGDHPVQVRGRETEGFPLNPGQVPFHRPELGLDTLGPSWWKRDSAEDIYQRNKVLLVDPSRFMCRLAFVGEGGTYLAENKRDYYRFDAEAPDRLFHRKGREIRRGVQEAGHRGFSEVSGAPDLSFPEIREIISKLPASGRAKARKRIPWEELVSNLA